METDRRALLTVAGLAAVLPVATIAEAADGRLCVVAELIAKPGQEQLMRTALIPFAQGVPKEPGCVAYHLHEDLEKPGRFVTYEVWKDAAALAAHFQTPAMKAAGPQLAQMLAQPLGVSKLRRLV